MRLNMSFVLGLLLSQIPIQSLASSSPLFGNERGNGGDAVVCMKSSQDLVLLRAAVAGGRSPFADPTIKAAVTSVQILDVFEKLRPQGFPPRVPTLVTVSSDIGQEVKRLIERMKLVSKLGDRLITAMQQIPTSGWRAADGVVSIDDSQQDLLFPENCALVQAAVRNDVTVSYDAGLFMMLDDLNRVALVLHEIAYKVAAEMEQKSSRARLAVGLMLDATSLEVADPYDIHLQVQPLDKDGFAIHVNGKQKLWVSSIKDVSPRGMVSRGVLLPSLKQTINIGAWRYESSGETTSEYRREFSVLETGDIEFYPDGKLLNADLGTEITGEFSHKDGIFNCGYCSGKLPQIAQPLRSSKFEILEDGRLKSVRYGGDGSLSFANHGTVFKGSDFSFFPSGNVEYVRTTEYEIEVNGVTYPLGTPNFTNQVAQIWMNDDGSLREIIAGNHGYRTCEWLTLPLADGYVAKVLNFHFYFERGALVHANLGSDCYLENQLLHNSLLSAERNARHVKWVKFSANGQIESMKFGNRGELKDSSTSGSWQFVGPIELTFSDEGGVL